MSKSSNSTSTYKPQGNLDTRDQGECMYVFAEARFIRAKPEKPHKCPLTEEENLIYAIENNTTIEMNKLDLCSHMVNY